MYIYYIVLIIFGILAFKDLLISTVLNKYILTTLIIISLVFFIGFRYNSDNDYWTYVFLYDMVPAFPDVNALFSMSILQGQEFGFLFIESVLRALGFGYQSVFIFSAIITTFFLYKAYSRIVSFPVLALFVFFSQYFLQMFIQIRFGIATAISLYACTFLSTDKKRLFWLLLLTAFFFHFSSLGIITVYFFYKINWNRKKNIYLFFLICAIVTVLPLRKLLENILLVTGIERYQNYLFDNAMEIRTLIFNVIIIIPLILFRKSIIKKNIDINLFFAMAFNNIFVGAFVWQLSILYRFSTISGSIFCVIIPSYLLLFKSFSMKVCGYFFLFLYCFLKFLPAMRYVSEYQIFLSVKG